MLIAPTDFGCGNTLNANEIKEPFNHMDENHALSPVTVDAVATKQRMSRQASSDEQLIRLWLHSKATRTQKAYSREARLFLDFVAKPLPLITIEDLQGYVDSLNHLAAATRARTVNAIKSLLTFGHTVGYLPANVGTVEKAPKVKNVLPERILSPLQVQRLIALEPCDRNRLILLLLYASGMRVSELCQLKWRDVQERDGKAQLTVFGKGSKTRFVLIPGSVWSELKALEARPDDPVFLSAKGGHLTPCQVWRVVQNAAGRAGIKAKVSPHWLRHAFASHSLDRGCPLSLLQQSLGHSSAATSSKYLHARPDDSAGMYLGL